MIAVQNTTHQEPGLTETPKTETFTTFRTTL